MDIKSKYCLILRNVLALNDDVEIEEIERGVTSNWDSVGHVALVNALEEEFDIMFEIEDILSFTTFHQGLELLGKYGVK